MENFNKTIWIIVLIFIGLYLLMLKSKAKLYVQENPEIRRRTNNMYWNIFIYISIPFILHGVKELTGETETTLERMKDKECDLIMILSDLSWLVIYFKLTHWMFIRKGAEFLSDHPDLLLKPYFNTKKRFSAKFIKFCCILLVLFGMYRLIESFSSYCL